MNFYTSNFVRVSWCGIVSDYFVAINGVKQGSVLSPVLFCLYIDGLLVALSKSRIGCFIGSNFVGALAYADDIVLLAPSASVLRNMLAICDNYARDYHIEFNAKSLNVKFCCLARGAFYVTFCIIAPSLLAVSQLNSLILFRIWII